jgi:hypothetical protein
MQKIVNGHVDDIRVRATRYYNTLHPECIKVGALQFRAIHIHAIPLFGVVDER